MTYNNVCLVLIVPFIVVIVSADSLVDLYTSDHPVNGDLYYELLGNKSQDIAVREFPIIPENCTIALELFAEKVTNLTRCTINNARPIRVCMNCQRQMEETQESFSKLRLGPLSCQQFYFGSDQIGIVDLIYAQGQVVWTKNNCQNCYDHFNLTENFFNVSQLLDSCILNSNQSSNSLNTTCELCHDLFVNLNDLYNTIVKTVSTYEVVGVCMDVVDRMNITRRYWNTQKCSSFDSNIGYPNIVTAVLVGSMPVLFYMLAKNISIIEDVKLVRPKRKSYSSMPTE